MFEISRSEGEILLQGRLDAAQADQADAFLEAQEGDYRLNLSALEYISSAGLGVLLKNHKKLMSRGQSLTLTGVGKHIGDIFRYSGFDKLFTIVPD